MPDDLDDEEQPSPTDEEAISDGSAGDPGALAPGNARSEAADAGPNDELEADADDGLSPRRYGEPPAEWLAKVRRHLPGLLLGGPPVRPAQPPFVPHEHLDSHAREELAPPSRLVRPDPGTWEERPASGGTEERPTPSPSHSREARRPADWPDRSLEGQAPPPAPIQPAKYRQSSERSRQQGDTPAEPRIASRATTELQQPLAPSAPSAPERATAPAALDSTAAGDPPNVFRTRGELDERPGGNGPSDRRRETRQGPDGPSTDRPPTTRSVRVTTTDRRATWPTVGTSHSPERPAAPWVDAVPPADPPVGGTSSWRAEHEHAQSSSVPSIGANIGAAPTRPTMQMDESASRWPSLPPQPPPDTGDVAGALRERDRRARLIREQEGAEWNG